MKGVFDYFEVQLTITVLLQTSLFFSGSTFWLSFKSWSKRVLAFPVLLCELLLPQFFSYFQWLLASLLPNCLPDNPRQKSPWVQVRTSGRVQVRTSGRPTSVAPTADDAIWKLFFQELKSNISTMGRGSIYILHIKIFFSLRLRWYWWPQNISHQH